MSLADSERQGLDKKLSVLEDCLSLVAVDITPAVMSRYYSAYPGVESLFQLHGLADPEGLERSMVDQALYCVMTWFVRPGEILMILSNTVPYHESIGVARGFFSGLLCCVIEEIGCHVPQCNEEMHAVLNELKLKLVEAAGN